MDTARSIALTPIGLGPAGCSAVPRHRVPARDVAVGIRPRAIRVWCAASPAFWIGWTLAAGQPEARATQGAGPFRVRVDGKYGYVDRAGKWIGPRFASAQPFRDGRAAVSPTGRFGKWGYVDAEGNWVAKPAFAFARDFSEGLAPVNVGGRWSVGHYHEWKTGAWWFGWKFHGGKWGFVKRNGEMLIEPRFSEARGFAEGLAPVCVRVSLFRSGWGYIDRSGKMAIAPKFDSANPFSEGLARVRLGGERSGRFGFIDKSGKLVIPAEFSLAFAFHDARAPVRLPPPELATGDFDDWEPDGPVHGRWGYIDRAGAVVVKPAFHKASEFSEGLACVEVDRKFGYVDPTGKPVIPLRFTGAGSFSNGLARVQPRSRGPWGYINKAGRIVIQPRFAWCGDFARGLAEVQLTRTGVTGFIDRKGVVVLRPRPTEF